jgi:hypothetical protein
MPKLSRNDLAHLIASRMQKCTDLQHKSFVELGKLYLSLTEPSAQKQYRTRVKTVKAIQQEAQKAAQQVKDAVQAQVKDAAQAVKPVAAPAESVDDIVRKIEQQNKER